MTFHKIKSSAMSSTTTSTQSYISLSFPDVCLLYPAFFALGFGKAIFYFPLFVVYYFLKLPSINDIRIQKNYFYFLVLIIYYIFFLFAIGAERMTLDHPWRTFAAILFSILATGLILYRQNYNTNMALFSLYVFGLLCDSLLTIVYSAMQGDMYGYGRLISPFNEEDFNSPGISNLLGLCFSFFYYIVIHKTDTSTLVRLFSAVVLFASVIAGIFLGGRTFFLICGLTVIFFMIFRSSIHTIILVVVCSILMTAILYISIQNYEPFFRDYEFIKLRFQEGLESGRFELYSQGLDALLIYPLGGSHAIGNKWFFNLFLDTARVAGWLPLILFILSMVPMLKAFYSKRKAPDSIILWWVFFLTLVVMSQEVIIEGNPRVFTLFYISAAIILTGCDSFTRSANLFVKKSNPCIESLICLER